ncbi:hypothetical protein [Haloarcula laminariae]|uniref:hypothetical protein n=1 Tax=Haloarcula laminariae TaxID=2961577 RepID=UPI002404B2C8|nr:hypothetical protein [Halomicroarcula sp. FL173]
MGGQSVGQISNVSRGDSELPPALTRTAKEGLRSGEYLADRPAIDAVAEDETVEYVMTNRERGIEIERETTTRVVPDSRYETVVVVTDRRVIALVGKLGGDRKLTLDIAEITDVATTADRREGRLTLDCADGPTWRLHTEADGLGAVADYLRRRHEACATAGRVGTATRSLRGLFETTVDSAKSLERDRVAELIPSLDDPQRDEDERTDTAEPEPTATDSRRSGTEPTPGPEKPDKETAIDEILQALAKTDWRARGAQPESPFDLLAEREDELVGVVVHCPDDGRLDQQAIRECDAVTGAGGTDTVMLATTGTISEADARLAADLGVRLRNVSTMRDTADPPTVEAVREMVSEVLGTAGWAVRSAASGPFDLLAERGDELMGVVVHSPEAGTVRDSIERCSVVTGAAGTDTAMLATTGTVRAADERLAGELGVRLVESDSLAPRHVTEVADE